MANSYTTNYNLDKYVATDKPNLRDQYNSAMDKIDTALHTNATNTTTALQTANAVNEKLGNGFTSQSTVTAQLAAEVSARQNADTTLSQDISNEVTARQNADSALSNDIGANATAISAEKTARQDADTALDARLDELEITQTEAFFFGDSWGVSATSESDPTTGNGFILRLAELCSLNINNYNVRGCGFVNAGVTSETMIQILNRITVTTEMAKKTKYVFVCCGTNDGEQSQSDVGNAMATYFNTLKNKFPYSKIIYTPNYRKPQTALAQSRMELYYTMVSFSAPNVYVNDSITWLPFVNWWASDGVHLSGDGMTHFADMIYKSLYATVKQTWPVSVGPVSNSPLSVVNMSSGYYDGIVHIRGLTQATRDFSSAQNVLSLGLSLDPAIFPDMDIWTDARNQSNGAVIAGLKVTSGGGIQIYPYSTITSGTQIAFNITYATTCYKYA